MPLVNRAPRLQKLIRFGLVGLLSNLSILIFFWLLIRQGIHPVAASVIAYVVGVTLGYLLHRTWSFRSVAGHHKAAPMYLFAYAVGAGLHSGNMALMTVIMDVPPLIAQVISIGVVAVFLFVSLDRVVFAQRWERDN